MPSLSITNLTKVYSNLRKALDKLDLHIGNGVFGLLGPNGAGKSTLIQILSANLDYERGDVLLDNKWNPQRHPIDWRRRLSTVPQSFDFIPHLTGKEYLEQYALLAGYSPRRLKTRIETLLQHVNLFDARNRNAGQYSRGMKQRLAIAAAFLCEPELVLLDEPTSGLDPKERVFFRDLLAEFGTNRIVILSTHIVGDIERCSERMAVLDHGRVLFEGAPSELSAMAAGCVFELELQDDQIAPWQASRRLAALSDRNGVAVARVIAGKPPTSAVAVNAGMEDGYFYLLNRESVKDEVDAGR